MGKEVYIQAIRTMLPPFVVPQETALVFMQKQVAKNDQEKAFIRHIYESSGIQQRYSVIEDFQTGNAERHVFFPEAPSVVAVPDTEARNRLFTQTADRLASSCAQALFADVSTNFIAGPSAGKLSGALEPKSITHLITVSSTGFSAPGFAVAIQKSLGLDARLKRMHLGFMGCAASIQALQAAWNICKSSPGAKILVVAVELCTLHLQHSSEPEALAVNALFGDGAFAMLVSADRRDAEPVYTIHDFYSTLIEDSAHRLELNLGNTGVQLKLSSHVPQLIGDNMERVITMACRAYGCTPSEIARWAIHPGSRAILDNISRLPFLQSQDLAVAYQVLRDYGNTSAANSGFMLARTAQAEGKSGLVFAAVCGSGLSIESMVLERRLPGYKNRHGVSSRNLPLLVLDISLRSTLPQLMRSPDLHPKALETGLRQAAGLNALFSSVPKLIKQELFGRIAEKPAHPIRILDVGCGYADTPRWIVRHARKLGMVVKITCIDSDRRVLDMARKACASYSEIQILEGQAEKLEFYGEHDFVLAHNLLYQLSDEQIPQFLGKAINAARINILCLDTRRSRLWYVLFGLFAKLVFCCSPAAYDGRLSILRGFTINGFQQMLVKAGLDQELCVYRQMPWRLVAVKKTGTIRNVVR